MSFHDLDAIHTYFQHHTSDHPSLAVQVCLHHSGKPILNQSYGSAENTTESPMLWMSAGKPLTAALLLKEIDKRDLSLDSPVSRWLPQFALKGKESITLRHLLTHTGGFRGADMGLQNGTLDTAVDHICNASIEPGWVPGEKAGYHINSSWIVLAAILEILCEQDFESIFSAYTQSAGLENTCCLRESSDSVITVYDRSKEPMKPAERFNDPFFQTLRPGSNITGPASSLATFYTHLLHAPSKLGLSELRRDEMISRQRKGMQDATFRAQMDWGLGVIVNTYSSNQPVVPYGFGPHASENTVGHGGSQCSVGFMDPEFNLTGAIVFNDMPGEPAHQKRLHEMMRLIYETLGLTQ